MTRFRPLMITLATCCTLMLAGCESDEDKAERFYQAGLTLLEQGDKERAVVELRNVFNHDGFHKEARLLYAGLVLELGRGSEAYGQYLRLIEQYPDTVEARVALAKMAMSQNNWEEVARHGMAAVELSPDQPDVQAVKIAIDYRQSVLDEDLEKRTEAAAEATRVLAELRAADQPDNDGLVRVVIDSFMLDQNPTQALAAANEALARAPKAEDLNMLKIRLLAETQDVEGTGAHLKNMVTMFPENLRVKQALIRWHLSQGDTDGAEAFLRAEAGDDAAPTQGHVEVIQLLQATKGADAARAELERLRDANKDSENGRFYTGMLASMDFQSGDRDAAITAIASAIDGSEEGAQKIRLQVMHAQMLLTTGAQDKAYALVDAVLEADASNVPALRMRAARLIDEDKPGEAIVALRAALDQNPRDPDTLTMMAQAHERDGDTELVGERLALAMEASGNGVPHALRYAQFLIRQDRQQVAVTVLEDARRRSPNNVQLMLTLANLHMQNANWTAAKALIDELRAQDNPQTQQAATELEARMLQVQDRADDSLALLEGQLGELAQTDGAERARAIGLIIQNQIRSGNTDAARETLDTALADTPDSADLLLLSAVLYMAQERYDQAETIYNALIDRFPESDLPVRMLINMLNRAGDTDKAREVLNSALERMPDRPDLLWINASLLEADGDIDGAIAIYETLYDANSASPVVANNLASLITTHRDDAESLARAANIVRRLRDTKVPAFQDTYGWIAYRRDDFEEAVKYLEPAALGLPRDALVQYHLGMAYVALNRTADARAQLEKALELAGDNPLPQFDNARETLAGLE